VTQDESILRRFFQECGGQVITKPLSVGHIERTSEEPDSLIYTNVVHTDELADLRDLSACPTLFQRLINKQCDVRITVVDDDIHAVELIAKEGDGSQRCDVRRNNMTDVEGRAIALPPSIAEQIRILVNHYRLRFAAIDMAVSTSGEWFYFEINPNGQWAWLDLTANTQIVRSFANSFAG
jgi:hypothetical protein